MKLYRGIISKPGKIISFSVLNERGFFRRTGPDAIKGKFLMQQKADFSVLRPTLRSNLPRKTFVNKRNFNISVHISMILPL